MQPSEERINILLVDDHPENLLALEAMLGNLGQNLVKAHSGREALRHVLDTDFAVIVLDVQMPGMDGFETAALIRGREKSRRTPIIFLTAIDRSDEQVFQGYSVGAVDYLFKPFVPEVLKAKVAVFVDLFKKTEEVKRQAEQLEVANKELKDEITTRRRAEEALRKSEELYHTLARNFPNGAVLLFDQDLRYTVAEGIGLAAIGLSREGMEGKTIWEAVPPEICTLIEPRYRATLTGTVSVEEVPYGDRIYTVHTLPVHDAAGEIVAGMVMTQDITERKAMEEELRDQQFYTRSLIESNIDALMTTDPLGIITDVNQQMEALTGCKLEELIGSPFKHYFTDPQRAEDGIRLVVSEGKVTNYELTAHSKEGHETVVSYNATTFFDREGKLQGVFAAARDVTERKRFEQTLQEKNIELENASLAKDRFLASMSHELRTPLNAIIGFTGTLLMKLPGPLTTDQEKQLRIVQGNAKHLVSLINDLLDLAKIESGKVELHFESVVCQSVIQEVAASLRPLAEVKGLQFELKAPPKDTEIWTDRRALNQILINLTNNAIKFTETGRVGIVLTQHKDNGQRLTEISVEDTGVGILPEDQAKLFQAFERLNNASTRRYEGTGLGLHLSQKLASLLGGHVTFSSEYGKGSTFTVVIPEK